MSALARATGVFFAVRVAGALLAATPLTLTLRSLASRHPDGDDALFADLLPRLGDLMVREPRLLTLPAASLLLLTVLSPLGEGLVDRVGTAILAGRRTSSALSDSAHEAFRLGGVSVFGCLFRLAAIACVVDLFRYRELTANALALPATISFLLLVFLGVVLALRDLLFVPSASTLKARVGLALRVLLQYPARMVVLALCTRALALAFAAVAFVASTSPAPRHGAALWFSFALCGACYAAAACARALRFAGLGALVERIRPEGARTDDRSDEPGDPSLDPGA